VLMIRARIAGMAMLVHVAAVSVSAGPVPVLAHGTSISRLINTGQRV